MIDLLSHPATVELPTVKKGLEEAAESECPLMQRSEITLIFGKISPIIEVHEQIISRLRKILDNWTNDGDVAQVWVDAYEDLNRVYVPYSNAYDTAREKLILADKASPRLHAFIRAKECNSNFNRNTMQDLLIRPVQRLPTLIVLLRELQKRRDRKSEIVERAIASIDKIVSRANDVRAQNDNFIEQLHFFNEVEGVPV
ncbi:DH domain-containing protein [Trichostrongylus colubriformis]|uniref:DH domain-containing protein n=1 Tax=Trichostrongylus colubriformis TaxID=6319 RepID=A0AAN8EP05_TRICO